MLFSDTRARQNQTALCCLIFPVTVIHGYSRLITAIHGIFYTPKRLFIFYVLPITRPLPPCLREIRAVFRGALDQASMRIVYSIENSEEPSVMT